MKNTTLYTTKQDLSKNASIHSYFIDFVASDNKDTIVKNMLVQAKKNPNFSLGEYLNEEKLETDLKRKIFGNTDSSKLKSIIPFTNEISEIFNTVFKDSFDKLPFNNDIDIYVMPFCNEVASKDLKGVNAFPLEDNILYLFIDVSNKDWKRSLEETIPHEYAHLAYSYVYKWNSILDGIVNEGLAEHFRSFVVGGDLAPWSIALERNTAIKELNKLEGSVLNQFIDENNVDFYISYFFGTKNLPKWFGYSLGYWLIDEVIIKQNINLMELFKRSPKDIMRLFKLI